MDEILALQQQLQAAQDVKASTRLSERIVVELVNKLKVMGLLGDDLMHTVNGKEFITRKRLQQEMKSQLLASGGRLSLTDMSALIGVDLTHCEREAKSILEENPDYMLLQGELLVPEYFDGVAAELNETLQEEGQLHLAEVAKRFSLSAELMTSTITSRLGTLVDARMEGSLLYTQAYVSRLTAQVRGLLRGSTGPLTVSSLESSVCKLSSESATSSALVRTIMLELCEANAVDGHLRGGGSGWVPSIFAKVQEEGVRAFFTTNNYIEFSQLRKMDVNKPADYLERTFPDGVSLATTYISSSLVQQLELNVEEALSSAGWCDVMALPVLPPSCGADDASRLLEIVRSSLQDHGAQVLPDTTCVFTEDFLRACEDSLVEFAKAKAREMPTESTGQPAPSKQTDSVDSDEDWDDGPKGKKGRKGKRSGKKTLTQEDTEPQGRGKKGKVSKGKQVAQAAMTHSGSSIKSKVQAARAEAEALREAELAGKLIELHPELEDVGDGEAVSLLVEQLRPSAVHAFKEARQAIFSAGAEERKKVRDAALNMLDDQMNELEMAVKGLSLFEESTAVTFEKHLLRTVAVEVVDLFLRLQDEQLSPSILTCSKALSNAERREAASQLPKEAAEAISTVLQSLKEVANARELVESLRAAAFDSGMRIKALDKKREKAFTAQYIQRLQTKLQGERDPPQALTLVVPLLFAKVFGQIVIPPGKGLASAVPFVGQKLRKDMHDTLIHFHQLVVQRLSSNSDVSDVEEQLEALLPTVKRIAMEPVLAKAEESTES